MPLHGCTTEDEWDMLREATVQAVAYREIDAAVYLLRQANLDDDKTCRMLEERDRQPIRSSQVPSEDELNAARELVGSLFAIKPTDHPSGDEPSSKRLKLS